MFPFTDSNFMTFYKTLFEIIPAWTWFLIIISQFVIVFCITRWLFNPLWKKFQDWYYICCHVKYSNKYPEQFKCFSREVPLKKCLSCAALFSKDKAILLAIGITFGITLGLFFVWIFQVILYIYFKFNVVIL